MTTIKVTYKNAYSGDGDHLVTEASTLGLPPGKWPAEIAVDGDIGTGAPLVFNGHCHDKDGDLIYALYVQRLNPDLTLKVYND